MSRMDTLNVLRGSLVYIHIDKQKTIILILPGYSGQWLLVAVSTFDLVWPVFMFICEDVNTTPP